MAWQCLECTRFWGHCHKHCILCRLRLALRMSLRQKVAVATVRALILQFAGRGLLCSRYSRDGPCAHVLREAGGAERLAVAAVPDVGLH